MNTKLTPDQQTILVLIAQQLRRLDPRQVKMIISRRWELDERARNLFETVSEDNGETISQRMARVIMGPNIIGVPELEAHFGPLDPHQKEVFETVPFSEELLRQVAGTSYMLVADLGLSLVECAESLDVTKTWWWAKPDCRFSHQSTDPSWRLIYAGVDPESLGKEWGQQKQLLQEDEYVPMIREVAYFCSIYRVVVGQWLFRDVWLRTGSEDRNSPNPGKWALGCPGERRGFRVEHEDECGGVNVGITKAFRPTPQTPLLP